MQDTNTTIRLPLRLTEPLRREAKRQGTEMETLVGRLIAQYLHRVEPDKLSDEIEAYRAMHSDLFTRYRGRYVAMHGGQVVDDDADRRVTDEVEREFVVLSPRLERGES